MYANLINEVNILENSNIKISLQDNPRMKYSISQIPVSLTFDSYLYILFIFLVNFCFSILYQRFWHSYILFYTLRGNINFQTNIYINKLIIPWNFLLQIILNVYAAYIHIQPVSSDRSGPLILRCCTVCETNITHFYERLAITQAIGLRIF